MLPSQGSSSGPRQAQINDSVVCLLQAHASAQAGTLLPRERQKQEYQQALVERYKHLPEVKRINRHRHLPTPIYKVFLISYTYSRLTNV